MCFWLKIDQKPCSDNLLTTFRRVFDDFSTSFRRLFDDFSTTLRGVFDGSSTKRRDGKNEKGYHDIPPKEVVPHPSRKFDEHFWTWEVVEHMGRGPPPQSYIS